MDDIHTFVEAYQRVDSGAFGSLADLYKDMGVPGATATDQLERVASFAAPGGEARTRSRIDLLFRRRVDWDDSLRPTAEAGELYKYLSALRELYLSAGQMVRERTGQARRRVRLGMSQNFGLYLFSSALSGWRGRFGGDFDLSVEFGNTKTEGVPRLRAGLLDALLAYGPEDLPGVSQPIPDIKFSSFGYRSNMVLIAHPRAAVLAGGRDVNRDYYDEVFAGAGAGPPGSGGARGKGAARADEGPEGKRPLYRELREVDPDKIDYSRSRLIYVPSWAQPAGLERLHHDLHETPALLEVSAYDEALALVRMNFGVCIVPQVHSKRAGITAFRLPAGRFTRYIGAYYSARFGLTREAYELLSFLRQYVGRFGPSIRDADPPDLKDRDYAEFCETVRFADDWRAAAEEEYPGAASPP